MPKCIKFCQARKNGYVIVCVAGQDYEFSDGDIYPAKCFRTVKTAKVEAAPKKTAVKKTAKKKKRA